MFTNIHHVGYLVDDLDRAIAHLATAFGTSVEIRQRNPATGAELAFVRTGDTVLELVAPPSQDALGGKKGFVLHHVAYLVSDLPAAMSALRERGVNFAAESPNVAANGTQVIYLHPESTPGTLVHLVALPEGR